MNGPRDAAKYAGRMFTVLRYITVSHVAWVEARKRKWDQRLMAYLFILNVIKR